MNYIEIACNITPFEEGKEIIAAELSNLGFESFSESENTLLAYINEDSFNESELLTIISKYQDLFSFSYSSKIIKQENWNAVWESNFEPVIIENKILVRAPFHKIENKYQYEIIIEPKMSFGTAHHETTSLMMQQMLEMNLCNNKLLDMGCGTAILAIFAKMLQAKEVVAIDNDEWAYENSIENINRNGYSSIIIKLGGAELLNSNEKFDVILANINKNILLNDMKAYTNSLKDDGYILLSGFYESDLLDISSVCTANNLKYQNHLFKNNWVAALFKHSRN